MEPGLIFGLVMAATVLAFGLVLALANSKRRSARRARGDGSSSDVALYAATFPAVFGGSGNDNCSPGDSGGSCDAGGGGDGGGGGG